MKRPTSVTVISWILIVLGGISLITTTAMMSNPMAIDMMKKSPLPLEIQYAMSYLGILVTIVSGIAMLQGRNWGRLLYAGWSIFGFAIGLATSPMKAAMIPGIVVFLIACYFLFGSKASKYFASDASPKDPNA